MKRAGRLLREEGGREVTIEPLVGEEASQQHPEAAPRKRPLWRDAAWVGAVATLIAAILALLGFFFPEGLPLAETAPTAVAYSDQQAQIGTEVTLNGSRSTGVDGHSLTFKWTQTLGPAADLSDSSLPDPTFIPMTEGTYVFSLVVSDGGHDSAPDTVSVRVSGNCDPAYPDFCIPSPPPDLDCGDIDGGSFTVLPPDPHGLDGNNDNGLGCEGN